MKRVSRWVGWLPKILATCCLVNTTLHAQTAPDRIWVGAGHAAAAYASAFSPDGTMLASGSYDQTVKLWNVASGALVRTISTPGEIYSVAFSPDGNTVASAGSDAVIRLWSVADGSVVRTLTGHSSIVRSVAFSPDGTLLASGAEDNTARLWRVSDGALMNLLAGHSSWVSSVTFSPDGSILASGSYDHTSRLWRVADGAPLAILGSGNSVYSVAFSPDGATLASAGADLCVRFWRVSDGSALGAITGFANWIWSAAFSPDGSTLVTADSGALIKLWRMSDGTLLDTYQEVAVVAKVEFSPGGTQFGYGRGDSMVVLANNPLTSSTSISTPSPTLDVLVSTDKPSYVNKAKATILVSVTDGVKAVASATVAVTVVSPTGARTTLSGKTGSNGVAALAYTINSKLGIGTYAVTGSVTKSGYISGGNSTSFVVTR